MPKATLTFSLPAEQEEYDTANKAGAYAAALHDIYYEIIRKRLKYQELTDGDTKIMDQVRDEFFEILNSHGIEI